MPAGAELTKTPALTPPLDAGAEPGSEALFERYLARQDAAAFEALARRYQHFAFRVAASVCGNSAVAEEAVQEAFVRVARAGHTFKNKGAGSFRAWFYQVLVFVAGECHRKERR